MTRVFTLIIAFTLFFLTLECFAEERNYSKVLKNKEGEPVLEVTCEYIGKQPFGEFVHEREWENKDTDFYIFTYRNLTGYSFEFIQTVSYFKFGKTQTLHKRLPNGKTVQQVFPMMAVRDFRKEPLYEGNTIEPFSKKIFENKFVYDTRPKNVGYDRLTLRHDGKNYTLVIYMVYKKEN